MISARRVVFFGNRQADALRVLYQQALEPRAQANVEYIPSYQELTYARRHALEQADVIVEQVLDLEPPAAAATVSSGAERILLPLAACNFLWPFADQAHPANQPTWFSPHGSYPAENGDSFLNRLIASGTSPEAAADKYLSLDFSRFRNLDRLYELVMDRQRRRDAISGFRIADAIEARFRHEPVFLTSHHPALPILLHLAEQLFRRLGMNPDRIERFMQRDTRSPLPSFQLPIHPAVARHFGLRYANESTRYRCGPDRSLTFREWVISYMAGQWNPDLEEGISLVQSAPALALQKLETGLTASPDSAEGHFAMGNALLAMGKPDEAELSTRRALQLSPDEPRFHHLWAVILGHLGRWQEALPASRRAIELDPADANFHLQLANVLMQTGNSEAAEPAMREAARLQPGNAHLRSQYGHLLARLNQIRQAKEEFAAAVQADPDNPLFHRFLSNALDRLGDTEAAIASVRQAIMLRPDDASDYAHLARLLRIQDNLAEAIAACDRAVALAPEDAEYAELRQVLRADQSDIERQQSGAQEKVAVGADGWLFHRIDAAFEQVCGGTGLSPGDHARLLTLWETREAWCQARGIDYRLLIVPERHALYPDKLPDGFAPHPDRPALSLIRAADALLRPCIIYPDQAIRAGRPVREVCYRTDVHWTRWGAYLAYRELMSSLPRLAEIVPESRLILRETRMMGDMMRWLDGRERETMLSVEPPPVDVQEAFTNRTFQAGQVDVYETANRHLPSLVLFRTSNSTLLLPFLYHHFSRIVAVASVAVHYDLLRSERPDVVISEISERYLAAPGENGIRFPHDFDPRSFSEFTGVALPLPRATQPESPPSRDLESSAREICRRNKVPETHWHLYLGRALQNTSVPLREGSPLRP